MSADRSSWEPQDADLVSERARRFSAPKLRGRHVHLRIVTPDDYTHLQLVETSSELAPLWRLRGATPSPQEWMQASWRGVLAQFMVIANRDQVPVGLVAAIQPSFQDGHARLEMTRFDLHAESPLMDLGAALFIDYVFRCWNFRKLYLDLPEYSYPQFSNGYSRALTLEGRLKDHYYLDNQLWDRLIFAIYRATWTEHGSALLQTELAR
jgi:hypothetical protein